MLFCLAHPASAGVSFRNLNATGYGSAADYQKTVGNVFFQGIDLVKSLVSKNKGRKVEILKDFDGLIRKGEMLVVLGPPGSGCSTLLKTLAGETHGFKVQGDLNYQGISPKQMHSQFKGEAILVGEVDVHFPQVAQPLSCPCST